MMNDGKPTTEKLYAWLAVQDYPGIGLIEGVITVSTEQGQVPLMATDKTTATWMTVMADEMIAAGRISNAYLVEFHRGQTIAERDVAPGPSL